MGSGQNKRKLNQTRSGLKKNRGKINASQVNIMENRPCLVKLTSSSEEIHGDKGKCCNVTGNILRMASQLKNYHCMCQQSSWADSELADRQMTKSSHPWKITSKVSCTGVLLGFIQSPEPFQSSTVDLESKEKNVKARAPRTEPAQHFPGNAVSLNGPLGCGIKSSLQREKLLGIKGHLDKKWLLEAIVKTNWNYTLDTSRNQAATTSLGNQLCQCFTTHTVKTFPSLHARFCHAWWRWPTLPGITQEPTLSLASVPAASAQLPWKAKPRGQDAPGLLHRVCFYQGLKYKGSRKILIQRNIFLSSQIHIKRLSYPRKFNSWDLDATVKKKNPIL